MGYSILTPFCTHTKQLWSYKTSFKNSKGGSQETTCDPMWPILKMAHLCFYRASSFHRRSVIIVLSTAEKWVTAEEKRTQYGKKSFQFSDKCARFFWNTWQEHNFPCYDLKCYLLGPSNVKPTELSKCVTKTPLEIFKHSNPPKKVSLETPFFGRKSSLT